MENKKNRSEFSNSQDQQYCISVAEYPESVMSKKAKGQFLIRVQSGDPGWTKVNLKKKLKYKDNWRSFLSNFHQNVGYLNENSYPNIKAKTDGIKSDFIFLDFDNKDGENKLKEGYLSYDAALTILKNSGLNYVLSTSSSHEVNHHKLHILIPTLKPIDSSELYKYYLNEVNKLFVDYVVDPAASSIANNKFGGNPSTINVDVEFSKKDFHLDNVNLGTKKFLKKVSQAKTTKRLSDIPSNALFPYDHQVKKMHGLILDKGLSFSNSLAFRRDESDRNAGVFCVPYSNNYNPNLIFDHQLKKNEKKREFETFFALEDYVQRKNPKDVRGGLQSKISRLIEDWVDPSIQSKISHKYLVTNEGLGKSTTVLRLGLDPKKFSFIYATYTKQNMEEKSEYLDELGVPY
ncbi:MAG: hypothetical protein ACJATX_000513, partial [Candidatus Paceibacteria bacterium]